MIQGHDVEQKLSCGLDMNGLNQIFTEWDVKCRQDQLEEKRRRASVMLAQAVDLGTSFNIRAHACYERVCEETDGQVGDDSTDKDLDELSYSMYLQRLACANKTRKLNGPPTLSRHRADAEDDVCSQPQHVDQHFEQDQRNGASDTEQHHVLLEWDRQFTQSN